MPTAMERKAAVRLPHYIGAMRSEELYRTPVRIAIRAAASYRLYQNAGRDAYEKTAVDGVAFASQAVGVRG
jgi:hypothetical protein